MNQTVSPIRTTLLATAMLFAAGLPVNAQAQSLSESERLQLALAAQSAYDLATKLSASEAPEAAALFRESAAKFQEAVDGGAASGELQFNLGNAFVQAGDPARGIGSYLEAERLLPGDSRIATNLAHARNLVGPGAVPNASTSTLDRIASAWAVVAHRTRLQIASGVWIALWGIVAVGILTRWAAKAPWRLLIAVTSTVCAITAATLGVDALRAQLEPQGVLVADEVIARKGNGEGFAPAFTETLTAGSEFTLVEARPGWYCIRLGDGQIGWVPSSDAVVATGRDPSGK
ncbi:MAG: hypothetical protein EXS03_01215 [Phycisphaerales bacterium]|nr:hypothetical protein [Phycisphaerales bacterium]